MTTPLPTNLDATYADSGTDATVKLHQQYHDAIHAKVNKLPSFIALFNVELYGAVGDGVTDDTAAIQAAITAAQAFSNVNTATGVVYFPQSDYKISATLVGSAARLNLRGESKKGTRLIATSALTGFMVQVAEEWSVEDMGFYGTNQDGQYGFGTTAAVSMGTVSMERCVFSNLDYGIRFAGGAQFPLSAIIRDVYMFGVRSCGLQMATNGHVDLGSSTYTDAGQSGWTLDNIVVTNGGATQYISPAASLVETANSPDTSHDALSWSSTGQSEFGWVVMRRATGDTVDDNWQHVAYVPYGTTTYSAAKAVGENWDYVVQRNTHGVYLRRGKAVSLGVIQCEYMGVGLGLDEMKQTVLATFYSEWRGLSDTTPALRGDGVRVRSASGLTINSAWGDEAYSVISLSNCPGTTIRAVLASGCQRSAVHMAATSTDQTLELGPCELAAGTPVRLSTDGSAYSANYVARNPVTDVAAVSDVWIDHTTKAEWVAGNRGTMQARFGADNTGAGYAWLATAGLPSAAIAYNGEIRRVTSQLYQCTDRGTAYFWSPIPSLRHTLTKTTNFTLAWDNEVIISNGTSLTHTLPSAAAYGPGRIFTIRNIAATAVTVNSAAGNVDGGASVSIAATTGKATFISDGTNWWTI